MTRRRVSSSRFRPTQKNTPISQYDRGLTVLSLMLLCIGLLMVLSANGVVAGRVNGDKYFFFKRQLIYIVIGGVVMWVLAAVPRYILYKLQYPSLLFVLMLLFVTLSSLGTRANGAQHWVSVKFFSVQPLGFVKTALALYLAYSMNTRQGLVKMFSKDIIPLFAMTALFCLLLLAQPDFSRAVVLSLILSFMRLIGRTRFICPFMAIGVGLAGVLALIIFGPYHTRRLVAFLDPFADAQNAGYQLAQSLYALGSGGLFGASTGSSPQKMFYLPEAHDDSIMTVVDEELSFFGMTLIMVLSTVLFMRCYKIIMEWSDLHDRLSAFGMTLVLTISATLNLAVVMGIAPSKGVAMPFLSYGGSSLFASMTCIGLLLSFSRTAR